VLRFHETKLVQEKIKVTKLVLNSFKSSENTCLALCSCFVADLEVFKFDNI